MKFKDPDPSAANGFGETIVELTNGNYVVASINWDAGAVADVGAVTWGNGATGTSGAVSSENSLVGSTADDKVGVSGLIALTNGNYVQWSSQWDCSATLVTASLCSLAAADVGVVTWGNGATGTFGPVSSANSLVGSTANDAVGRWVIALTNGNYVVSSQTWDCTAALCPSPAIATAVADVGAVTWGDGATSGTRLVGPVSSANSLVGSTANDWLGSTPAIALTNGNYLVRTTGDWDCTLTTGCPGGAKGSVGAVTWGSGTTGVSGPLTASNSLIGGLVGDQIGYSTPIALTNGNVVFANPKWGLFDPGLIIEISGTGVH